MPHLAVTIRDEDEARVWADAVLKTCQSSAFSVRTQSRTAAELLAQALELRSCFVKVREDQPVIDVTPWIDQAAA